MGVKQIKRKEKNMNKSLQQITEAYEKETGLRRDLVDIDDQEIIEIETDKQRAKRHKKEYTLIKVVI